MNTNNQNHIYLKILILLLLSFNLTIVCEAKVPKSIKKKLEKAEDNFANAQYEEAIKGYTRAIEKMKEPADIYLKIADSYMFTGQPESAYSWYNKYISKKNSLPDSKHIYYYANTLNALERHEEAANWFEKYSKAIGSKKKGEQLLEGLENVSLKFADSAYIKVDNIGINSSKSEFSPSFYKSSLVFASDRKSQTTKNVSTPFDLFVTNSVKNASYSAPVLLSKQINTEYNEGPIAFFDNFNSAIYTSNNPQQKLKKKGKKIILLGLFMSKKDGDKWLKAFPLPFNNPEYSVGHPTVNKDGTVLYFVSDKPGGQGGTDIYKAELRNGKWGAPRNLGPDINTEMDESFPYLQGTMLYFTSNGHSGLGGLDNYQVDLSQKNIKINNLGYPINTKYDDFGIIVDKTGISGYLSSNRPKGKGGDDIYSFKSVKLPISIYAVMQDTEIPVEGAAITVKGGNGETQLFESDEKGRVSFVAVDGMQYSITAEKGGELPEVSKTIFSSISDTSVYLRFIPKPDPEPEPEPDPEPVVVAPVVQTPSEIYKVQIGACRTEMKIGDLRRRGFRGKMSDVEYYFEDNWHKYSIGTYNSLETARDIKRSCDVFDAFVVGYRNGVKMSYQEVNKKLKEIEGIKESASSAISSQNTPVGY